MWKIKKENKVKGVKNREDDVIYVRDVHGSQFKQHVFSLFTLICIIMCT